jgi:uncharacterized protein (TIGR02246 family)
MKKIGIAFWAALAIVTVAPSTRADDGAALQRLVDKEAIEDLLTRYTHALDNLDADAYAGVFTEDAVFELGGGETRRGRAEIRRIITERQDDEMPPGLLMHHVVTNATLEFVNEREVHHYAYWMTIVGDAANGYTVPAMGRYDDVLVKQGDRWLIKTRKLLLPSAEAP